MRARTGFALALLGAAVADDAVATAKPATIVSESAAAAIRRRAADVVVVVEFMQ